MKDGVRTRAARVLTALISRSVLLDELLAFEITSLAPQDHALLRELTYGVCRWASLLDALLQRLLSRPLRARDLDVKSLLYVGLYQLRSMRIPAHAVVSETVSAAVELRKPWAKGLVNAALRRYLSNQSELESTLSDAERSAHPFWLLNAFQEDWPHDARNIVAANNYRAPMTLRCRAGGTTRERILETLKNAGIAATPTRWSQVGIQLTQPVEAWKLPAFSEGAISVQDEGAQLAVPLLKPKRRERILDACAAPGGKTCHILESEPDLDELVSIDISQARLERLTENLRRCRLVSTVIEANIADLNAWWDGRAFDAILADLPCSATGVIRRHPDIKLLRRAEQVAELSHRQSRLLERLWLVLKPGGRLLYSTCSVFRAENDRIVEQFLAQHDDALPFAEDLPWGQQTPFGRQLLPSIDSHDGFYYSLLFKRETAASLNSGGTI